MRVGYSNVFEGNDMTGAPYQQFVQKF